MPTVKAMTESRFDLLNKMQERTGVGVSIQTVAISHRGTGCPTSTVMPVDINPYRQVSAMQANTNEFEFRFLTFVFPPTFHPDRSQALTGQLEGF